jgi:hypothetical protein
MLKAYINWFSNKIFSFLRIHIWLAGIIVAFVSAKYFAINILAAYISFNITADILIYKVFKLKESQFKNATAFFQETGVTPEQWDLYVDRINKYKIPILSIALFLNAFVFKQPLDELALTTSFGYFFMMFFVIRFLDYSMKIYVNSKTDPYSYRGQVVGATTTPIISMAEMPQYETDAYIPSSIPTFETYTSTPNFGVPGFNIAGVCTGSDTAIGGISN